MCKFPLQLQYVFKEVGNENWYDYQPEEIAHIENLILSISYREK